MSSDPTCAARSRVDRRRQQGFLQRRDQAYEPHEHAGGDVDQGGDDRPLASIARDSVSFNEPSALALITKTFATPWALRRNLRPSDARASARRRGGS